MSFPSGSKMDFRLKLSSEGSLDVPGLRVKMLQCVSNGIRLQVRLSLRDYLAWDRNPGNCPTKQRPSPAQRTIKK